MGLGTERAGRGGPWITGVEFPSTIAHCHLCTYSGPTAPGRHKENNFAPAKDKQEMETMIRELQGEISQPGPWAKHGRGSEQG